MATTTIHNSILACNKELIVSNSKITIKEYIHVMNDLHYNMNITYLDELFELVTRNDCCIPHTYLEKYGVIKLSAKSSNNVLRLFIRYSHIEGIDYRLRTNAQPVDQGGVVTSKIYYLHPRTFKQLLMSSRNTSKYRDYYILLEECVKYYNDLQVQLLKIREQSLLEKLDETNIKLDQLNKTNKELLQSNNKHNDSIKELIQSNNKLNDTNTKLNETINKLNETNNSLNETINIQIQKNDTLNASINALTHELSSVKLQHTITSYKTVTNVTNVKAKQVVLIFKHNIPPVLYKIRGVQKLQEQNIINSLSEDNYDLISKIDVCNNPVIFKRSLREQLANILHFNYGNFTIIDDDVSEEKALTCIHEVHDSRIVPFT